MDYPVSRKGSVNSRSVQITCVYISCTSKSFKVAKSLEDFSAIRINALPFLICSMISFKVQVNCSSWTYFADSGGRYQFRTTVDFTKIFATLYLKIICLIRVNRKVTFLLSLALQCCDLIKVQLNKSWQCSYFWSI